MRLRFLTVSLLLVAAGTAGAQVTARKTAQAGESPELRIDYTKETLPNGLTVIYHSPVRDAHNVRARSFGTAY
jgi:hypothetical protein